MTDMTSWPIFPVSQNKVPCIKGGCHAASSDFDTIAAWGIEFPNANYALATGHVSGVVVVDCDGAEGIQNFADFMARITFDMPDTLMAESGGGGRHFFFKHPGAKIKTRPLRIGRAPGTGKANYLGNVDIRGDGGSIILPPAIHKSGRRYKWLNSKPMQIFPIVLLPYCTDIDKPEDLRRPKNYRTKDVAEAIVKHLNAAALAGEGERNHVLNRSAFIVGKIAREAGEDPYDFENDLIAAGMAAGLQRHEARATVRSGLRAKG